VTVTSGSAVSQGTFVIANVTPGLFAANQNGQGVAAAIAVLVQADGTQTVQPVLQLNSSANLYEAVPSSVGSATSQLYLIAFGTGFRNRSALTNVSASIGGAAAQVSYSWGGGGRS
jgi:uncharacterized protein (TIGR03437 family)